jgi:predicted DNA-binding transcriptional regulator AlpA
MLLLKGGCVQRQLITAPVPRLLGMDHAAAFLGISPRSFEKLWRSYKLPQPYRLGRRLVWDIKILEEYVDALRPYDRDASNEGW